MCDRDGCTFSAGAAYELESYKADHAQRTAHDELVALRENYVALLERFEQLEKEHAALKERIKTARPRRAARR